MPYGYEQASSALRTQQAAKKRKKYVTSMVAKTNTTGNKRSGRSYFEQKTSKGTWHIYDNGQKVLVKKTPKLNNPFSQYPR